MRWQVLGGQDVVDQYRERMFEELLRGMMQEPTLAGPGLQYVLATRHLERIADHATNISEDIIFWVRGLDVRHGRGLLVTREQGNQGDDGGSTIASRVTENSLRFHPESAAEVQD